MPAITATTVFAEAVQDWSEFVAIAANQDGTHTADDIAAADEIIADGMVAHLEMYVEGHLELLIDLGDITHAESDAIWHACRNAFIALDPSYYADQS